MRRPPIVIVAALSVCLAACGERPRDSARAVPPAKPGPRISMAALHMSGGVPPGWHFTPPPGDVAAGRAAFQEFGCPECHAVQGEPFSRPTTLGPELTGMGTHHPPEYFAEAILNPDAVLVDGPTWIGSDGRSTMPAYPQMTVAQLADLVAYLSSLTVGGHQYQGVPVRGSTDELPPPPETPAGIYFVQAYQVRSERLGDFEAWFRMYGARGLLAHDGLVSIETWIDSTREGSPYVSIFGFRSDADLERFLNDDKAMELGATWDSFIGPHPHLTFRQPPLYRVPSLSAP